MEQQPTTASKLCIHLFHANLQSDISKYITKQFTNEPFSLTWQISVEVFLLLL